MGFKIWCQVGVWGTQFSKLPYSREFSNMRFKSCLFWNYHIHVSFYSKSWRISELQKTKGKYGFDSNPVTHVARWEGAKRPMRAQFKKFRDNSRCTLAYLFLPSGSSESPTPASAEGASLMGWDGVGSDGNQKCPFKFFILCGYID